MTQQTTEDRRMLAALRDAIDRDLASAMPEPGPTPAPEPEPMEDELPEAVQDVIDRITNGWLDPYVEILLSHLHNRKRRLRGVRGF